MRNLKDTIPYDDFDRFSDYVEKVRMQLSAERNIINLVLFRHFTNSDIEIDATKHAEDIDFALEYGYFDNQFIPSFNKAEADPLVLIEKPLNIVLKIMKGALSDGFKERFKVIYNAPLNTNSKEFWEKVFKINIEY